MYTLIILPGWGGTKETWKDFVEKAMPLFEDVEVIELPCFGAEPCPSQVWGVEEYADFVKSKIKNQKSKIVLFGHSFGGAVAICLTAKNPGICDILVLSGAAVFRRKKPFKRAFFGFVAYIGKRIFSLPGLKYLGMPAKKALYRTIDSPDYHKTDGIQREIFQKIIRQDVSYFLSQITAKTLVVWGEFDTYVPLVDGRKIAEEIPGAKLRVIPQAGHGLHINHTQLLLNALMKFIHT